MAESTPARSDSVDVKSPTDEPTSPGGAARSASVRSAHLSQRSCVTCRRRKVRCDKIHPSCTNCTKAGIECVFPGPGRAKRKTRKPQDAELLARLKKLEGVIQSLGAQVEDDNGAAKTPAFIPSIQGEIDAHQRQERAQNDSSGIQSLRSDAVDNQLGRLVINEGRSRYVSNAFWASMGDEMAEMRDILDAPSSEDDEDFPSPDQSVPGSSSNHQGFVFGYSSMMNNLRKLHPSLTQLFVLWKIFEENVDPVVRILHRPTVRNVIIKASSNTETLSKSQEVLLFAIYYGAVCSLTPAQCNHQLGEDKDQMSSRFRFAVEQALARANFLNTSSLMVLQALVLFLICVRSQDDTRTVWSLSGLATRLAQALGVHRDGTVFGLTPFETEMRRRLWWHISILDTRAAEDHGADPSYTEAFYDAQLPLNINDDDISPETKDPPQERKGTTEMTFCLIRFELSQAARRMNFAAPGKTPAGYSKRSHKTLLEREKIIEETHQKMEERYLKYCDMTVPIFWVSATVGRLVLAKMWLMTHHPLQYNNSEGPSTFSQDTRDRLFVTSVEVIEFAYLLEKNENTAKWGWLFRTYMQWHAVAFVLSELCTRPPGPDYERAWKAVESVYDERVAGTTKTQKGMLWKPMRQLMTKASNIRESHRKGTGSLTGFARGVNSPIKRSMPWQQQFVPSDPALLDTQSSIRLTMEVFGLDLTQAQAQVNAQQALGNVPVLQAQEVNLPQQQVDHTPVQRNFSDEDVSQWLAQEQMLQQNSESFNWSNWSMGTLNIGDVPMTEESYGQFAPAAGVQEWF